MGLEGGFK